jgi:hypothetical protein
MERYRNLGKDSGIDAYEIGSDFIKVRFKDIKVYTYTYGSAGQYHIEKMKSLAQRGSGLNQYINLHVKNKYASKH